LYLITQSRIVRMVKEVGWGSSCGGRMLSRPIIKPFLEGGLVIKSRELYSLQPPSLIIFSISYPAAMLSVLEIS